MFIRHGPFSMHRSPVPPARTGVVTRRIASMVVLMVGMVAFTSCFRPGKGGGSQNAVTLLVNNRGYFDVNVHVLRSLGGTPKRVGQVTGNSSQRFRIAQSDLQGGTIMMVQVRAISGRQAWTSPSLAVDAGTVAILDVVSTNSGDVSQSQFYRQ